ncbi:MAG: NADH-quinone oxidoreductase subunit A [Bacteroidales bacterium]
MTSGLLITFFITAIVLVAAGILAAWLLAPTSFNKQKAEPYECGIPTKGTSWMQFNVGYYLFALLFLIFDVETVFLFPWAVVMKTIGMTAFIEILIFFVIIVLGLAYAWKKQALKWQ